MKKRVAFSIAVFVCIAVAVVFTFPVSRYGLLGAIKCEPFEAGRPLSYWAQALKDDDVDTRQEAALILSRM